MHQQDPALPSQSVIPPATIDRLQPHGSRVLPVKSSALKLPDRFRVKLVFAASFPPSTASWDTTFLLLVSAVRRGKKQNRDQVPRCNPGRIRDFSPRVWGTTHRQNENCVYPPEFLLCSRNWYTYSGGLFLAFHSSATGTFLFTLLVNSNFLRTYKDIFTVSPEALGALPAYSAHQAPRQREDWTQKQLDPVRCCTVGSSIPSKQLCC